MKSIVMSGIFSEKPNISWKDILAYSFFSMVTWMLSLTICFPFFAALIFSSSLRNSVFAWIDAAILRKRYSDFTKIQQRLFQMLEEQLLEEQMYPSQIRKQPIRFLEVGPGSGTNFKYYPENHLLTLLDMNPSFRKYLMGTLEMYPNINLENTLIGYAENMDAIKNNEFDVVVATHLLCSVNNVDDVLREIQRVLKPGGKCVLLDHIVYPINHPLCRWIQWWMTPLWKVYFNGCHLNRDIFSSIQKAQFSKLTHKIIYPQFCEIFFRPHILAICTK